MASIYKFYIKNYLENGVVHTGETLFQDYPLEPGQTPMLQPKVKGEMGKAGSFEFAITPAFSFYKKMLQMKTMIRVEYFGKTIFRGRVLTIENADIFGSRSIHCEGDFAFFMDSQQEGIPDDKREKVTLQEYIESLISIHNSKMENDPDKQFVLGEVPGHYTSATTAQRIVHEAKEDFGDSSWGTTMDRLEDLVDKYGGFFRTRYSNGVTYLDWLETCYDPVVKNQKIEISKNLLSAKSTTEVDNLFTKVIPLGGGGDKAITIDAYWPTASPGHDQVNYILVPELATIPLFSDAELNKGYHSKQDYADAISMYGYIEKTVNFENAKTAEELFTYATDWIKMNYCGGIANFDITAVDMKIVDGTVDSLWTGDTVDTVVADYDEETRVTKRLTIISCDKDIYSPEADSFNIGTPNGIINAVYGNKGKNGGGGGGGPSSENPSSSLSPDIVKTIDDAVNTARSQYWIKVESNGGIDIRYDDAMAAFVYTTEGINKSAVEVAKDIDATLTLQQKREIATNPILKDKEALEEYLMSIPKVATKVQNWKVGFVGNLVSAGLPLAEASLVVADESGMVHMASYVDDEGNPKYAPMNPELVTASWNARKILGNKPTTNTEGIESFVQGLGLTDTVNAVFGNFNDFSTVLDPATGSKFNVQALIDPEGSADIPNLKDILSIEDLGSVSKVVIAEDAELTLPEVIKRVKDGVAFGIYDEENLTAGVIVSKINEGSVFIKGSQIQIGGVGLDTKLVSIDSEITNIGTSIEGINDELADQETELSDHSRKITAITSDVTLIGNNLTQAQLDIALHGGQLADHALSITAINTDVASITSQVTTIGGELNQAQLDIATNGQSIIALNSDVVSVENELQAAKARIGTLETTKLSTSSLASEISKLGIVSTGSLTADSIYSNGTIQTPGSILAGGTIKSNGYTVLTTNDDPLQTFSVTTSGNTVTLTWTSIHGGHNGTASFSKAGSVTLSGSWSGNKYTVTASTGQSISETLTPSPANASTINTFTNHMAYITVAATSVTQGPLFRWTVDATSEYNAGYAAGKAAMHIAYHSEGSGNNMKYTFSLVEGAGYGTIVADYTKSTHSAGSIAWTPSGSQTGTLPGVTKNGNTIQYASRSGYTQYTARITGDSYNASSLNITTS